MPRPKKPTPVGVPPRASPTLVRDLMGKFGCVLSAVELARFAGVGVQRGTHGGYKSSSVSTWLTGRTGMPLNLYDLVRTKLWLIERGLSTKQEMLDGMVYETLDRKLTPAEALR
jgi:hypothetical protein